METQGYRRVKKKKDGMEEWLVGKKEKWNNKNLMDLHKFLMIRN